MKQIAMQIKYARRQFIEKYGRSEEDDNQVIEGSMEWFNEMKVYLTKSSIYVSLEFLNNSI